MGEQIEGLDSPDSLEIEMDVPVSGDADTAPAESSPANDKGEKFDLLSVVRNAVPEPADEPASPTGQEEASEQPKTAAQASSEDDERERSENFEDVPFHTHPRFREVVQQRNQFREAARQYEQVQEFLVANDLTPEDAANALQTHALMKQNPQEAWKRLKPLVQKLLVDAGEVLPSDLTEQVRGGKISREAAMEISRLRAQNTTASRQVDHQREQAEAQRARESQMAVVSAVGAWESSIRQKDPDFAAKADDIQREVLWLQRQAGGMPSTPEGARKMLEEAYANVNKRRAPVRKPPKAPVTGGRVASGQPAAAPGDQPRSMLDVVKGARL